MILHDLSHAHGGSGGKAAGLSPELMWGGGAVLALVLLLLLLRGGSRNVAPGFDVQQGKYNIAMYQAAANRDIASREIQAGTDREVIRAGVSLAGIQADAAAKRDANTTARDIGLRQLEVADRDSARRLESSKYSADKQVELGLAQVGAVREVGLAEIGARERVGMAGIGVQQYSAETARQIGNKQLDYGFTLGKKQLENNFTLGTQKLSYDYQLGQGSLANERARDEQNFNLGMDQNNVQRDAMVWDFFGNLFGGVLGIIGKAVGL